jgi:hypothetical protein
MINSNYRRIEIARAAHATSSYLAKQLVCAAALCSSKFQAIVETAEREYVTTFSPSLGVQSPIMNWQTVLYRLLGEKGLELNGNHFVEQQFYHVSTNCYLLFD